MTVQCFELVANSLSKSSQVGHMQAGIGCNTITLLFVKCNGSLMTHNIYDKDMRCEMGATQGIVLTREDPNDQPFAAMKEGLSPQLRIAYSYYPV